MIKHLNTFFFSSTKFGMLDLQDIFKFKSSSHFFPLLGNSLHDEDHEEQLQMLA